MKTFGQEFYPQESIRALRCAYESRLTDREELLEQIAAELPQESVSTRLRIAAKIIQRYITTRGDKVTPSPERQPFVRLVALSQHPPTQIELLYWQLSRVDTVVGALARELFYPVCIEGRPPEGYGAFEFGALNGSRLFMDEPILTREFILGFAASRWRFDSISTIDRSLRVLQSAGLIESRPMMEFPGHPAAYALAPHNVSLTTFVWALNDEFLPDVSGSAMKIPADLLPLADFARTLLLTREQVAAHAETAMRQELISSDIVQTLAVAGSVAVSSAGRA